MARRSRRTTRNVRRGKKSPPWGLIAAGAGIAGVGTLIWYKMAHAAPAALPSGTQTSALPPGVTATAPSHTTTAGTPSQGYTPTYGIGGVQDPSPSLVSRLTASDQARQVFALQSLLYSYGYTDAIPDGIEGGETDYLIGQINQLGSFSGEPNHYTRNTIRNAYQVMQARFGSNPIDYRVLPYSLPSDVIDAVNRSQNAVAPGVPPIQVALQQVYAAATPSGLGAA